MTTTATKSDASNPSPVYNPHAREFRGAKYAATERLDLADVAKLIRADIKAQVPGVKVSVRISRYAGGQSLRVDVKSVPEGVEVANAERVRFDLEHGPYAYTHLPLLSAEGEAILAQLRAIVSAYNRDNSDIQSDYFDVRFYSNCTFESSVREASRARVAAVVEAEIAAEKRALEAPVVETVDVVTTDVETTETAADDVVETTADTNVTSAEDALAPTAKQQARADRAMRRAAHASATATAEVTRARGVIGDKLPMGQPILVGHHSERRHRRLLERADRAATKAVEALRTAERAEVAAERAGSVLTSDDPEAIRVQRARLAELEAGHTRAKALNAAWRKGQEAGLVAAGLSEAAATELGKDARRFSWTTRKGPFDLANSAARVKAAKERLAELEEIEARRRAVLEAAAARAETEGEEGDDDPIAEVLERGEGWRIERDDVDVRVRIFFDGKPSEAVRAVVKRYGFRWAPSVGAWQRIASGVWKSAVYQVTRELRELLDRTPTPMAQNDDRGAA